MGTLELLGGPAACCAKVQLVFLSTTEMSENTMPHLKTPKHKLPH